MERASRLRHRSLPVSHLSLTYLGAIRSDRRGQLDGDTRPNTQMKDLAKKSLARLTVDTGAPASVLAEINGDLTAAGALDPATEPSPLA